MGEAISLSYLGEGSQSSPLTICQNDRTLSDFPAEV